MPSDPLRGVIDTLRSRLQSDLEAEFARLADSHEEALDRIRRETEAQVEQQWAARLEALRAEMTARVESEVAMVRTEAERHTVEATTRARLDAEQAAAEATAALRREMEQALATERAHAQAELDAERGRAQSRLEEERARAQAALEQERAGLQAAIDAERERAQAAFDAERAQLRGELESERGRAREQFGTEQARALAEVQSERQRLEQLKAEADAALNAERDRAQRALAEAQAALEAERRRSAEAIEAAKRPPVSLDTSRLVESLRAIDEATSLNGVIRAVVLGSASEARRAAVFVINGTQLDEWTAPGTTRLTGGSLRTEGHEAGLLADALRRGQPVASSPDAAAPAFAAIGADRQAFAVPFLLGGQPVAVLYADEGPGGERRSGWLDAVQIIGRHGAAALAAITARKTVEALRLAGGQSPADDAEQGARRYARLLVSELKLYNEGAVRVGRQMRDLGRRLRPEIDRARQMYSDRVSPTLAGRDTYFQQELVQTLADGDPSLLG